MHFPFTDKMKKMEEKARYPLGFFPTPLHHLPRLSPHFPDYRLYIKRDDQSGLAFGGNKVRKLEFLIKEALDRGCDTVVTAGAQQSNHCRQTAAACARAGLRCHLLLGGAPPDKYRGNLLLSRLLGAHIHFAGNDRQGKGLHDLVHQLKAEGQDPYPIPYGGSNGTGALGFVEAVKELKQQLQGQNLEVDYLFFASSSGGTLAGLMLGKTIHELPVKLMPVNIDKSGVGGQPMEETVGQILKEAAMELKLSRNTGHGQAEIIRGYDGPGYGVATPGEKEAIAFMAQTEGILLDPVYTGRAFYGMTDMLRKKTLPKNSNILFWHTGGTPAIFV